MASTSRKRKRDECPSTGEVCIIHTPGSNEKLFCRLSNCDEPQERLKKLQDIGKKRQEQPLDSPYRLEQACGCLPGDLNLKPEYGYHRHCYQKFTKNLDRLVSSPEVEANTEKQRQSERIHGSSERIIFNPDCIFYNKEGAKAVKKRNSWTTELTSSFDKDGWRKVVALAEQHNDEKLLRRIRGFDLFSC